MVDDDKILTDAFDYEIYLTVEKIEVGRKTKTN